MLTDVITWQIEFSHSLGSGRVHAGSADVTVRPLVGYAIHPATKSVVNNPGTCQHKAPARADRV